MQPPRARTRSIRRPQPDPDRRAIGDANGSPAVDQVERYLEDFDDLGVALTRLQDPTDEVLDWDQVKRELLDSD